MKPKVFEFIGLCMAFVVLGTGASNVFWAKF